MTCLRIFLRGLYHDLKEVAGIVIMLAVAAIPIVAYVLLTAPHTPKAGDERAALLILGWALSVLFLMLVSLQFSMNLYYAWRHTDIERIVAGRYEGEREVVAAEMRAIDERLTRCDYTEIRKRGDDVGRLFELRRRFHRS